MSVLLRVVTRSTIHRSALYQFRHATLRIVLPACTAFGVPSVAAAQGLDIGQMIQKTLSANLKRRIMVTPTVVEVDAHKKTATVVFTNSTKETLKSTLSFVLEEPAEFGANTPQEKGARQAGGLLAQDEDSATSAPAKAKTTPLPASWVKGLPKTLQLAPGEKKSLTLTLEIPANVKPGEYTAWIVANTAASEETTTTSADGSATTVISMKDANGKPMDMTSNAKLVYRVRAAGQ